MKLEIPYGRGGKMPLEIADGSVSEIVYPNRVEVADEKKTLEGALARPFGGRTLDEFLYDGKKILVIVNDATRPTPTARVLECIHDKLKGKDVKYISAVGSHRTPTETEHRDFFGKYYDEIRDKIIVHDSRNEADMVSFGKSKSGTEIRMNKAVAEANRLIIINSVEPHYFAGYTGGRKSLFPGLASYKSIEQNHRLALDARAATFALEGNPVHEDMDDIVAKLNKDIFSILIVLDAQHRTYYAAAGDYVMSFRATIEKANEVFAVRIKEKAEIVVTVAPYPTDIDLYQSQKSLDNAKNALKKGGIMVLVAECRDGIGNETFYKLLSSAATPQDVSALIAKGYKLGYHKAAKMAEIMVNGQIFAVTGMKNDVVKKIFIRPFPDVQAAVDEALRAKGTGAKVLVMMDGNLTVPKVG